VRQPRFRNAKDTNTFSLCVSVQVVSPSRQCNYALPSPPTLLFSFRAQRASATRYYWHFVCAKKNGPARLRLSTARKFSVHILSSCLSSWSQPRLPFCDMKLTLFLCLYRIWPSTRRFQTVSVHPHPHWNLLWNAQPRLPFCDMRLTFFCVSPLLPLHTTFFSGWVFTPIPIAICCALPSVRQQRGITDTFCVWKKKNWTAGVFDYRQRVSILFTFCPPAYLADLSNAVLLTHFVCAKKKKLDRRASSIVDRT
jgi:hypothetical protein